MRKLKFYTLDVFTDAPFGGNPLAVVLGGETLTTSEMQLVAREFQLSETVFLLPPQAGGDFRVRIFTPGMEMPFAGHPTIGTALLLALLGKVPAGSPQVVLEEVAGMVPVTLRWQDGQPFHAELTAPQAPEFRPLEVTPAQVAKVLGLQTKDLLHYMDAVSCGTPYLVVPLQSRSALQSIRFNVPFWEDVFKNTWASAIYAYCVGEGALHARMFAPDLGLLEDPATGSAAVCLAAALGSRIVEDGYYTWTLHQGTEMGRPSLLEITVGTFNFELETPRVGGSAVQMMEGTLTV